MIFCHIGKGQMNIAMTANAAYSIGVRRRKENIATQSLHCDVPTSVHIDFDEMKYIYACKGCLIKKDCMYQLFLGITKDIDFTAFTLIGLLSFCCIWLNLSLK